MLAYLLYFYLPIDLSNKSGLMLISVMLFPFAFSWFARRTPSDHIYIPPSDIEAVTFGELLLIFPLFLTFQASQPGVLILVPNQVYLSLFYGVMLGLFIAITFRPSAYTFPVSTDQAFQLTTVIGMSFNDVVEHIERDQVMKTFLFAPRLTEKKGQSAIFRRLRGRNIQLFLRVQKPDPMSAQTRIDMIGFERGKYVPMSSDLAVEAVHDKFSYLQSVLKRTDANLSMTLSSPIDPQRVIDDIMLRKKPSAPTGISPISVLILGSLIVAEVVIPAYFIAKGDLTSGLTVLAANTATFVGILYQTLAQRSKAKQKVE